MNIEQLRCHIINKRLKNETYESIAEELGISRSLVFYIETHENYKPGRHIKKLLGLVSENTYTCNRRNKLNEIARSWGYASWCAYETAMIKESECQNITQ